VLSEATGIPNTGCTIVPFGHKRRILYVNIGSGHPRKVWAIFVNAAVCPIETAATSAQQEVGGVQATMDERDVSSLADEEQRLEREAQDAALNFIWNCK
jgi:hypothetical protein